MGSLRVLTWHIHGAYLEALAWAGATLYVPVKPGRPERYGGAPDRTDLPASIVTTADSSFGEAATVTRVLPRFASDQAVYAV